VGLGVRVLARRSGSTLRNAGRATTADYAGLDEAGSLDAVRFRRTLADAARRGAPTLEVNCHPAVPEDPDLGRFGWGYRWADELAMLVDPEVRQAIGSAGYTLGGFTDLDRYGAA
jgi:hypothetical protein